MDFPTITARTWTYPRLGFVLCVAEDPLTGTTIVTSEEI